MPDHPRIRGEHFLWWWSLSEVAGSSPHTRGAPDRGQLRTKGRRIIPAYAGSTSKSESRSTHSRDHPRIRGEHAPSARRSSSRLGSSPHTRGALVLQLGALVELGIIPAYAGSTYREIGFETIVMDHPRIRGEHKRAFKNARIVVGSSPHTRGARAAA